MIKVVLVALTDQCGILSAMNIYVIDIIKIERRIYK